MKKNAMKTTKNLTITAMLAAVAVILGFFPIVIGEFIKIEFSGLPLQVDAWLFGPITGGIFGGVIDILKYLVRPTGPFFPGFTISGILSGIIYGLVYYRHKMSLGRIFLGRLLITLVVDLLCNTYWLSILYESSFLALLPMRSLKCLIILPVDTLLMFGIWKVCHGLPFVQEMINTKEKKHEFQ